MTIERRKTLYGKSLPFEQAVSIYTMRQIHADDEVRQLEYASRLIRWGTHAKLFEEILPGIPKMTLKRLMEREGANEKRSGGKPPSSMVPIIADAALHLQASLFIVILRNYVDRVERVVTAWAFTEAYALTRTAIGEKCVLGASEAYNVLVKGWAQKKLKLNECQTCQVPYITVINAIEVNKSLTHGECPHCRVLVSRDGWLPVQITPAGAERSAALLRGYLGT
mgnify:CR=1 FL=1